MSDLTHKDYEQLPEHIRDSVRKYIEDGRPVGDFLTAVFENNLKEAFMRADDINTSKMKDIVGFMYNHAPSPCWGSPEKVAEWLKKFADERSAAEAKETERLTVVKKAAEEREATLEPLSAVRARIQAFANKHKLIFEDKGECGFGRSCVGLNTGGNWLNYNPYKLNDNYDPIPEFNDDRLRAPGDVDAYHKHDCFAVLVHDEDYAKAIRGLDEWITHILSQGEVEVAEFDTGAVGIQALLSGLTGKALRYKANT